ncbi:MAG: hypothetical protein AB7E61_07220 [Acholeplasmataceae bacterium]
MARAVIEVKKPSGYNELGDVTLVALDGTDGGEVVFDARDIDSMIVVQNTAASEGTLVIKKGNGVQAVADFSYAIAASSIKFIPIESGFFKNVSGADKGKIVFTGPATLKVAVISHP